MDINIYLSIIYIYINIHIYIWMYLFMSSINKNSVIETKFVLVALKYFKSQKKSQRKQGTTFYRVLSNKK